MTGFGITEYSPEKFLKYFRRKTNSIKTFLGEKRSFVRSIDDAFFATFDDLIPDFFKWTNPGLFFIYFRSFQKNRIFYIKCNVKNVMSI